MGKVVGKLALIAGVIALNFIPIVGTTIGLALTSTLGVSAGLATLSAITALGIGAALSLASDALRGGRGPTIQ